MKNVLLKMIPVVVVATSFLTSPSYAAINYGTTLFENSSSTNSNYNRANAVAYAEKWADPGKTVQYYNGYYNFADGTLGGDCTNFASQVLHDGGGLPFVGSSPSNVFPNDWYYYGPSVNGQRTSSWTGASQFREFWGVVNGSGGKHGYAMRRYEIQTAIDHFDELYADLWPGDMIQYVDANGNTTHTQVIHAYSSPNLFVAQHSDTGGVWGKSLDLKSQLVSRKASTTWITTFKVKYASN